MIRHIIAIFLLGCTLLASTSAAYAERKLALLVGINDYQHLPPLEKAVGDVNAMARKLTSLNFDVTTVINPDRRTLNIALGRFAARLGQNDMAFVHFSGHGVEIDGDNYLLPRDIPKPVNGQRDTVKYEAISLRRLINQFNATGARARVFVIDACRDNPFEQSGVRSIGSTRGLARVEAPAGNFIMYSAGYRQMALDKLGPEDDSETSVYTRVLLAKLDQPGLPLAKIAREVRSEVQSVAQGIGHIQRPAYYDELSSPLVLVPESEKPAAPVKKAPVVASIAPTVPTAQVTSDKQIELMYWNEVRTSTDPAILESYIQQYPTGSFAPLARLRILALKNAKAKEQKAAQNAGAAAQSAAAEKAKEKKRLAALNNSATDANEAEENDTQRAISPEPVLLTRREIVMGVQRNLRRLGCTASRPDGAWGPRSRRALKLYARNHGVRLASLDPSQDLLEEMDSIDNPVCSLEPVRVKKQPDRLQKKRERAKQKLQKQRERAKRKKRTRKAKVSPSEPRHSKKRSRAERRKKTRTKKRERTQARVRILKRNRNSAANHKRARPKKGRRVCADRERALCKWDN